MHRPGGGEPGPARPLILGILNTTPDSFSDGGRFDRLERAVAHALQMVEDGADWVDIGGESTRPGAAPVGASEEADRVVPVIEALIGECPDIRISVDTQKAAVARQALAAGARVVNDVSALSDPEMAALCARTGASVILMHMRGTPTTMQANTRYSDLVGEVVSFLADRVAQATAAGIPQGSIWVDPGVGFGKALHDNPTLIRAVPDLQQALGCPVLIGASRKRFIGALTGQDVARERVAGSVGAALAATHWGANALRVHDVRATVDALAVYRACMDPQP